jgi:hypothetical protein
MSPASRRRLRFLLPTFLGVVALPSCTPGEEATEIVRAAIETHGGDGFDAFEVSFVFRGTPFLIRNDSGLFRYERRYRDDGGRRVVEWLDNEGTHRTVEGEPETLSGRERARVETAVNSVTYFALLPYRLLDPAARHRHLGEERLEGEPYDRIEVTFQEVGGGADWEDRFVYWIHLDRRTLDYLAYRYARDGGGTRFRRAVNRRVVGGITVQDYENYTGTDPVEDIAEYGRLLEEGRVRLVSMVELEDVRVEPLE